MSAFSPLGQIGFNPITTPLHHSEQNNTRQFEPLRGDVRIVSATNVNKTDRTHFKPIKTHNSNASPDIFEPPATRRKLNNLSFPNL